MTENKLPEAEECIKRFTELVSKIEETETVTLVEAYGRITAEDIYSGIDVPSFPRSAMDGYAVCAADISFADRKHPKTLKVIGEIFAGDHKDIKYIPDTAVRIMTGGYIPDGYDCVIKQEDTDYGEDCVNIFVSQKAYANYCPIGEDMKKGMLIAAKNTCISMAHIGSFASAGIVEVKVFKKLRTAFISTGNELVSPGDRLEKGKIYNSTLYMLAAVVKNKGCEVVCTEHAEDDENVLADILKHCAGLADIVITTGGVSVGKKDILKCVLENIGAKLLFTRVNIQPGTPTVGSVYKGIPIISLSGNPYAALVNFELYFWEIAAFITGDSAFLCKKAKLPLADNYDKVNAKRRFIRAYSDGKNVFLPEKNNAASVISNVANCNCFIDLEAGRRVSAGDIVNIRYMKD
ncbi:MAG: molybdopterin molybdotransferase MoeA [Firmicutes bacterium]|nr:molybdopterin molybdotransferase MoeA [Bacillota bacterium]